eukprot:COSAG02_NODE_387_length_23294_cov_52.630610_7_plen_84_part_00
MVALSNIQRLPGVADYHTSVVCTSEAASVDIGHKALCPISLLTSDTGHKALCPVSVNCERKIYLTGGPGQINRRSLFVFLPVG